MCALAFVENSGKQNHSVQQLPLSTASMPATREHVFCPTLTECTADVNATPPRHNVRMQATAADTACFNSDRYTAVIIKPSGMSFPGAADLAPIVSKVSANSRYPTLRRYPTNARTAVAMCDSHTPPNGTTWGERNNRGNARRMLWTESSKSANAWWEGARSTKVDTGRLALGNPCS